MEGIRALFKAFFMCFSMFTAIPCPFSIWENRLRPLMTAMLSLVGLCIGGLWGSFFLLCHILQLPNLLSGAFMTIFPWLISGFIHLDGFMDCCDGILSRRNLQERQRILKDSHCGAFAVISFVSLALVNFTAMISISTEYISIISGFLWISAIPRGLSAVAVLGLPSMSGSQYEAVEQKRTAMVVAVLFLIIIVISSFFAGREQFFSGISAMIGWSIACKRGYHSFQGMSGDISGYAITLGETFGLVALAIF